MTATCSRGWGKRCPASAGTKCKCRCGGANHGKAARRDVIEGRNDRAAQWEMVSLTEERVTIRDVGPWDKHFTVTNDAENVVARLVNEGTLRGNRRLFYFDSDGQLDEIVVEGGKFAGFLPGDGFDSARSIAGGDGRPLDSPV